MKKLIYLFLIVLFACSDKPSPQMKAAGSLYYSSVESVYKYDFSTKQIYKIYDLEYDYAFSQDGTEFLSYDVDPYKKETEIRFHTFRNPAAYTSLHLPYKISATPKFIPNSDYIGVLIPAEDDPILRETLILVNRAGKTLGTIPHVKDFAFTNTGKDLIVSAQSLDRNAASQGFAVGLVQHFMDPDKTSTTILTTVQNYEQLPVDLTVSPNNMHVAFSYLKHIYTLPLISQGTLKQITDSRFLEMDPGWSPDGKKLVFSFQEADNFTDCGEIRIVSASPPDPVMQLPGYDNDPVTGSQPVKVDGKVLHYCNSHGILWKN